MKSFDLALASSIENCPDIWSEDALIEAQEVCAAHYLPHTFMIVNTALAEIKQEQYYSENLERELQMAQFGTMKIEPKHSAY